MSATRKNNIAQSDDNVLEQSKDASLAERQACARASLARAKAILARSKTREEADMKNPRMPPVKRLSASEWKKKVISELAIPHVDNRWRANPNPTLTFFGKSIYRRKGPYGW